MTPSQLPDPERRTVLKYAGLAGLSALGVSTLSSEPAAAGWSRDGGCSPRDARRAAKLDRAAYALDRIADRFDRRAAYFRAKAGGDDGPPTPPPSDPGQTGDEPDGPPPVVGGT